MTTTRRFKFSEITRAKYNPRVALKPSDPEYGEIRNSIAEFGMVGGLVVNTRTNPPTLVGGHQRITILEDMGQDGADMVAVDLSPTDEKRLNVILNKVSGRWSTPDLSALLRDLQKDGIDLAKLGFRDPKELNALLSPSSKTTKRDPDDAPKAPDDSKAYTKAGDLYEITTPTGSHRVLCGSSTDPKDMAKLCGDRLARLVFTDPPYGVSYKGAARNQAKENLIANDDLRGDGLQRFLADAFRNAHAHTRQDAAVYCFYTSSNHIEFESALRDAGWRVKQVLNWFKSMVLGRSDYHWSHEPMLYGAKIGENCTWLGPRTETTIFEASHEDIKKLTKDRAIELLIELKEQTDVWEEKKDPPSVLQHPNQKPISLAGKAIRNSTLPNEDVLEPFLGSGSTLIAAEMQSRNCLGMELSRGHTDAIIRRFAETYERVAIKRNGKKFDPASVGAEP